MLRSPRGALIHEAAAGRASAAQAWRARPRGAACAKAESPRAGLTPRPGSLGIPAQESSGTNSPSALPPVGDGGVVGSSSATAGGWRGALVACCLARGSLGFTGPT